MATLLTCTRKFVQEGLGTNAVNLPLSNAKEESLHSPQENKDQKGANQEAPVQGITLMNRFRRKVFVKSIAKITSKEKINELFSECGQILNFIMPDNTSLLGVHRVGFLVTRIEDMKFCKRFHTASVLCSNYHL